MYSTRKGVYRVPMNFQIREKHVAVILHKSKLEFHENYLTGLSNWLKKTYKINYREGKIRHALEGNKTELELIKGLCRYANIDEEQAILGLSQTSLVELTTKIEEFQNKPDIDNLVEEICGKIRFPFETENHSFINRPNGEWLQDNFVEFDLLEVDILPSQYPVINKDNLLNSSNKGDDDFDRLGISLLHGKETTSTQILNERRNVFIYGDPGSGKSSYLKWVALKCRERVIFKEYVPLFLEIRHFAAQGPGQSLDIFIQTAFEREGVTQADLLKVIASGRGFFILDGIEETDKSERLRLERMINKLLINHDNCRFLISSRLSFNFQLRSLQKAIIRPFHSRKHIPTFINNWFTQIDNGKNKAQTMIDKLRSAKYQGIREISRRPVLLKLLCFLFQEYNDFPSQRASVFQAGVDELVKQSHLFETDSKDSIKLSKNDVKNILGCIASYFFIELNGDTLFNIREVESKIREYYVQVYKIDPYRIDAENTLSIIEQYNGLIVRWAKTFCSFSHLTYQEYFVAQNLIDENKQHLVYEYLTHPRWRFIIGLVAELLPKENAIAFFDGFKSTIDSLVNKNTNVKDFLEEISAVSSSSIHCSENPHPFTQVLIRAWYLVYAIGKYTDKIDTDFPSIETYSLPDMIYATSMVSNEILDLHEIVYDLYHCIDQEDSTRLITYINRLIRLFETKDPQKADTLRSWLKQIDAQTNRYGGNQDQWWEDKIIRRGWRRKIGYLMKTLRIPCTIELNEDQISLLENYYTVTHLFSTCINRSAIDKNEKIKFANSMLLIESFPPDEFTGFDDFFKN